MKNLIKVGDIIEITEPTNCMRGDVMKVVRIEKKLLRLMSSKGTYHIALPKGVKKTTKAFNTRWLTNLGESEGEFILSELSRGHIQRTLFIGQPKPTREYNTNELLNMNMVGVYDLGTCDCSICKK